MKRVLLVLCGVLLWTWPAWATDAANGLVITPVADITVTTTATLISAANDNRVALSCTNASGSINVRWGDSSITTTKGQRLSFGTAIEIQNRAAVYMIAESSTAAVACTEELR